MNEHCYLSGVTFEQLERSLRRLAPAIVGVLASPGAAAESSERFERPPNGPYRFLVERRTWERCGIVGELVREDIWRCESLPERPSRTLDSARMSFTVRRNAEWLVELGSAIYVEAPDDPVLAVTVRGNWRTLGTEQWREIVDHLGSLDGRIPLAEAPPKVTTRDGRTIYNTSAISRDEEETIVGFRTREGHDAAILSGGRIYWEREYAGVVGDEPYVDFLARVRAGAPAPGFVPERVDSAVVEAAILERHPELAGG